jgi:hypothetical protein
MVFVAWMGTRGVHHWGDAMWCESVEGVTVLLSSYQGFFSGYKAKEGLTLVGPFLEETTITC